jgi:hypothetical protein
MARSLLLLQLEALAVGALDLGGIGFVGADGDAVQTAVVGVLAVVGTVVDGALDALVRGMIHNKILLRERILADCRE